MDHTLESGTDDARPQTFDSHGMTAEFWQRKRQIAMWMVCILAVSVGIWRMAVFIPQPLDSPSTLRPLLYGFFSRFIKHYGSPERAFSSWYTICSIALVVPAALAMLNYAATHQAHPMLSRVPAWLLSRTLLFTSIAVCLFICRYPTLLEPQLNPDEGQFIASAHKLFYDANFFRADDCGTSGPINIYPLMLPSIFGISPDYASSRLIVLGILFLCVWLLYRTFLLLARDELARIAILPAAGMFAVFKHANLVHYSSEHVPVLLTTLGLYVTVRLYTGASYPVPLFLLGLLSMTAFFAKLQSIPILAALSTLAIAYVYITRAAPRWWRPALFYIAGAAPLPIANAALCLTTGAWHDFWMSYIVTNQQYADSENRFVTDLPQLIKYLGDTDEVRIFLLTFLGIGAAYAVRRLWAQPRTLATAFLQSIGVSTAAISLAMLFFVSNYSAIATYLALIAIAAAPAYLLLHWRERPLGKDPLRWFGLLALIFTLAAMFSVYEAHRPFPHYLLLLFVPLCTVIAWMLLREFSDSSGAGQKRASSSAFVILVVVLVVICQADIWGQQDDHVFKNVAATIRPPEGDFIRSMTSPDGQIEVWGWTVAPYLGSGRVPATRDTNTASIFLWPEISAYYRHRFLHDMREDPPEMFIDAVGPTSWALSDPKVFGFQQFAEIDLFINTYYVHVADVFGQHYYLRRDLAARNLNQQKSP